MVEIYGSSRYRLDRKALIQYTNNLMMESGYSGQNLSIALVGRRKMRSIMDNYHPDPDTRPVLSFPYLLDKSAHDENIFGEIVICYPLAVLLAAEKNKKVQSIFEFLVSHGMTTILNAK